MALSGMTRGRHQLSIPHDFMAIGPLDRGVTLVEVGVVGFSATAGLGVFGAVVTGSNAETEENYRGGDVLLGESTFLTGPDGALMPGLAIQFASFRIGWSGRFAVQRRITRGGLFVLCWLRTLSAQGVTEWVVSVVWSGSVLDRPGAIAPVAAGVAGGNVLEDLRRGATQASAAVAGA